MGDESYGGEMNIDGNFKNGLKVFREYAQKNGRSLKKNFKKLTVKKVLDFHK
jgi:hypothetical protein